MSRRRSRGGSLIEVLAAMSLFGLVASGVAALSVSSLRHTTANKHGTAATVLAQEQLENLRSLDYPNILPTSSSTNVGGQLYTVTTGVLTDAPTAGMKQITVTVTWTGPEGPKSYAIQTIFTAVTT
jgi:prepilin-type N-terminal cleavage/methylation domain-containing protein